MSMALRFDIGASTTVGGIIAVTQRVIHQTPELMADEDAIFAPPELRQA